MKLGDKDKLWAPYIVCKACVENLRKWTDDVLAGLRFGILMIERTKKHFDGYYFCMVDLEGLIRHKKST